jgi:deoxyhypusine synthase
VLFRVSEVSAHAESRERAVRIWSDTLSDENVVVFVSDTGLRIVATCMLITARVVAN